MAAYLNKWLISSVVFLPLLMNTNNPLPTNIRVHPGLHPVHVSVVEINHNPDERSLEMSVKIYTDDFENALGKRYNTRIDLATTADKAKMDTLVKKYLYENFYLLADGKPLAASYLGYEIDSEACYAYVELLHIGSLQKLAIRTSILYNLFEDQMNIIHAKFAGKRKSTWLKYPEKNAEIVF